MLPTACTRSADDDVVILNDFSGSNMTGLGIVHELAHLCKMQGSPCPLQALPLKWQASEAANIDAYFLHVLLEPGADRTSTNPVFPRVSSKLHKIIRAS